MPLQGRPSQPAPPRTGVARALSKLGYCSRSAAQQLVRDGRVTINDTTISDPETPVIMARDLLAVDGITVQRAERRYLMVNKPRGLVTSTRDEQDRDTVYLCLPDERDRWLAPVGRLDKASEGLLFFTNDSAWAHRLLDPASHLSKVYHVQVDRHVDAQTLALLRRGVTLADGIALRADAVQVLREGVKNCWLAITLSEGKNRHIRRLLEGLEIGVLRLIRVAIGPVALGDLSKGRSRSLTEKELLAMETALRDLLEAQRPI